MIALTPFILLVFAAILILVLNQIKINLGRLWLIAMVFSLLNWGLVLILYWFMPFTFTINNWFSVSNIFQTGFSFTLNQYSWIYLFSLSAVFLAVIMSESTRITEDYQAQNWVASFLIAAIGVLISVSDSILTIILVWTVIDLVEFGVILGTVKTQKQSLETVLSFVVRLGGTVLLIFAALYSNYINGYFDFGSVPFNIGFVLLISVGLRLGVLPFNLPYMKEIPLRRGLGIIIRMTSVVSSIVVINRFVLISNAESNYHLIQIFVTLAIAAGSILWVVSKNELEGRPFWIIVLSGFVIESLINGYPTAAIAWSLVLLLTGSVLFLFSDRSKWLFILPAISILSMIGLPFTPNAIGLSGLIGDNLIFTLTNLSACFVLIFGYLRFALKPAKNLESNERWVWLVYPLGLVLLIVTHFIVFFITDLNWIILGPLWISIPILVLSIVVVFFNQRVKTENQYSAWARVFSERLSASVSTFLRFDWLYKILWGIFQFFQSILNNLSGILEGHGGIIWVLVLVALLITLVSPKGIQ
ncbi:MAG: hypothetical protein CL609_06325 [Anaerolineaceae bacterium]|nr:hypothetical protein [Anaerolineaceae bacterium]